MWSLKHRLTLTSPPLGDPIFTWKEAGGLRQRYYKCRKFSDAKCKVGNTDHIFIPKKRQSHHSFPLGSQILWVEAERPPSLSSLWWPHSRGHGRSLWPFLDWMWSMCGKWWPLGSPSVSLVMDGKRSLLLATCKIRKYISVSESSFISVAPYYVHGTVKGKLEESFLFWLLPKWNNSTLGCQGLYFTMILSNQAWVNTISYLTMVEQADLKFSFNTPSQLLIQYFCN